LLDNANKPTREQTKESLVSDIESYLHFAIHDADTTGKYKDDDYERKPILGVREIAEKTFSAMQTKTQELNLENQHSRRA
jgi:hypothetical protein